MPHGWSIFAAGHPVPNDESVAASQHALELARRTGDGWLLVLLPTTPRPVWQLALFLALISVGGPTSLIGLDFAATSNPPHRTGSAQGIANMGGFVSGVLAMLAIGIAASLQTFKRKLRP